MVEEGAASTGSTGRSTVFRERLWPSPPVWLLAPGLATGVVIALVPLGAALASLVGIAVAVGVVAALAAAAARVEVSDGALRAGRAAVPLALVGEASWAAGDEARQQRGPLLDARAYLCVRGWVDPVVRVAITDPADPTPYWLISSRRPAELVAALTAPR